MKNNKEEKMIPVIFTWTQSVIDPVQYKPLAPMLLPDCVKVKVLIPDDPEYVAEIWEDGTTILTPTGLAYASKLVAKAIATTYQER